VGKARGEAFPPDLNWRQFVSLPPSVEGPASGHLTPQVPHSPLQPDPGYATDRGGIYASVSAVLCG